jgi:hypothetical protein
MSLSKESRKIIIEEFIKLREKNIEQNKKMLRDDCPLDIVERNINLTRRTNLVLDELNKKDRK